MRAFLRFTTKEIAPLYAQTQFLMSCFGGHVDATAVTNSATLVAWHTAHAAQT